LDQTAGLDSNSILIVIGALTVAGLIVGYTRSREFARYRAASRWVRKDASSVDTLRCC
jgi:hypothetical protein